MTEAHLSDEDVPGLAALAAGDPERDAAYAHASACPRCARALDRSQVMLGLLDALPPPPAPPAMVMQRIAGPILDQLAARVVPWRVLAGLLAAIWLSLVLLAKHRAGGSLAWAESLVLVAVAVTCVGAARRVGGTAILLVLGVSALFVAISIEGGALAPHKGMACLLTEVGAAVLPFFVAARVLAARGRAHSPVPLVVAAGGGALVAQAALHLTCPERTAGLHLAVFHLGGVALALAAAALAARLLVRRIPPSASALG